MHKIDLSENKFQLQRFILLQIVFGLFVVLFTYKWAYKVTHLIEQKYSDEPVLWIHRFYYIINCS